MGAAAHRSLTPAAAGEADVQTLLARAAMAGRLASCFRYPGPGSAARLRAQLSELSQLAGVHPDLASAARLEAAAAPLDDAALQAQYSRVFIGVGAIALNEGAYGPRRLTTAAELADVLAFYRAFGFDLSARSHETADHVGAELEFLAALFVKLAWATHEGLEDPREITLQAAVSFLEAHLGRWLEAVSQRIAEVAPDTFYACAAAEADRFVRAACDRLEVRPEPLGAGASGEPEPFSCPHAGSCG